MPDRCLRMLLLRVSGAPLAPRPSCQVCIGIQVRFPVYLRSSIPSISPPSPSPSPSRSVHHFSMGSLLVMLGQVPTLPSPLPQTNPKKPKHQLLSAHRTHKSHQTFDLQRTTAVFDSLLFQPGSHPLLCARGKQHPSLRAFFFKCE